MAGLMLTRKRGERIVINGEIEVSVHSIQGNKVKLVVNAPSDVPVWRGEVVDSCPDVATSPRRQKVKSSAAA